jgi:ABC-type nitrate/sulfonate/bicarbonate transport system substrate-binding protein
LNRTSCTQGRATRANITSPAAAGRTLTCLVALAAVLAGCGSSSGNGSGTRAAVTAKGALVSGEVCQRNSAVGPINFVSPYSYDASAGIMDVFMAQKLGYFHDLCLTVNINAASFTGEELVSAGRAQVTGIGSAADAILAAAGGANLTGVATYGDTDPHVILTNAKVRTLKQLEGGTLGYYTNITPGALQMLENAGVDASKIKFIKLTSYDPTIVLRGQLDGLIGYASNQGTTLKATGTPFNAFYPAQFGVNGTYNVMQFNTTWLHDHPAVAADFMRADLKALAYCLANKAACVQYMSREAAANHQGAGFPLAQQTAVWSVESKFVESAPRPLGSQTVAEWVPEYALVQKFGRRAGLTADDRIPPLASLLDPSLVASLYQENTLIWPGS